MSGIIGNNIVKDGLVLHLDAADRKSYPGSGTIWYDRSGTINNGTLTNGPTFDGTNGGTIVFDATNDYINIANTSLPSANQSHTVSSWIYKQGDNTINGWVALAAWGTNTANQKRMIFVSSNSGQSNRIYTGFYANDYNWGTGVTNNVWTYLVWTYNGSTEAIYLNGSLYGTHAVSNVNTVLGVNHEIGAYFDSSFISYYNGKISNFQIYNRALSAAEISQNFNATRKRFNI